MSGQPIKVGKLCLQFQKCMTSTFHLQ